MHRYATVDIERVMPLLGEHDRVDIEGYEVKTKSQRLHCFDRSLECAHCGINGEFFAIESHTDERPHLNLYAVNDNGEEILMTKDHIIPRSKGGLNSMDNLQTMCERCNRKKADTILYDANLEAGVTQVEE